MITIQLTLFYLDIFWKTISLSVNHRERERERERERDREGAEREKGARQEIISVRIFGGVEADSNCRGNNLSHYSKKTSGATKS